MPRGTQTSQACKWTCRSIINQHDVHDDTCIINQRQTERQRERESIIQSWWPLFPGMKEQQNQLSVQLLLMSFGAWWMQGNQNEWSALEIVERCKGDGAEIRSSEMGDSLMVKLRMMFQDEEHAWSKGCEKERSGGRRNPGMEPVRAPALWGSGWMIIRRIRSDL